MKNINNLYFLFFLFLLSSCGNSPKQKEALYAPINIDSLMKEIEESEKNIYLYEKNKNNVIPKPKYAVNFDKIHTVVVDSCEYLVYVSSGASLTHKGNCKFCAKRK